MAIDVSRLVREVAEAALRMTGPPQSRQATPAKKPFLSRGRAMLLGAGLVTAGRALATNQGRRLLNSEAEEDPEPEEDPQA